VAMEMACGGMNERGGYQEYGRKAKHGNTSAEEEKNEVFSESQKNISKKGEGDTTDEY
jgi:hypothetical protein